MYLDVLDGKELVCPLKMTSLQAEAFTTLMPSAVISMNGVRTLYGLPLQMAALAIYFPGKVMVYGLS